jgi:hypothetical protein
MPVKLGKASELAAALKAEATPPVEAPAEAPPAEPAAPPAEPNPSEPPAEAPAPETPAEEKPAVEEPGAQPAEVLAARNLRRLKREHKRLTERQAEWRASQAAALDKAAKWDAFQAAKASADPLAILRQSFTDDQIVGDLYQKLTEHVYSQAPRPLSQDEVDRRVKATLEREKQEREAAERKAAEETTQRRTKVERDYLGLVGAALSPERYPFVNAYGVHSSNVLAYSESFYKEHGRAPDGHEVLSHFEKQFAERAPKKAPPAASAPKAAPVTPSSTWRNDATPRNGAGKLSLRDSLEAAKREAGLLR